MIVGTVTANHEAVIRLQAQDASGQEHEFEAIIDTGFTGTLTLPSSLVSTLGLTWITRGRAMLANGEEEEFDIYMAAVMWDGQLMRVLADEVGTEPLVGMELLYGYDLHIHNLDGGTVTIERIARP